MFNRKEIFKASVCSFYENIYEYDSIDEEEFENRLKDFINEEDLDDCLEKCTENVYYDIEKLNNVCEDKFSNNKMLEINDFLEPCNKAFRSTIYKDKTINVEAFVENLCKEFQCINL